MDIKALISQMTLEEKAGYLTGKNFWELKNIDRLGIPTVTMTDGPCGVRLQPDASDNLGINESVKAISYPTGSCIASSFDRDLLVKSGEILAEDCLSYNVACILGPAANIKRTPLCGRNFEYFSEDPYVAGELAASYINGVQSKNVGTSLKHYACNNQETRRLTSSSNLDERTFHEIYLAGFEKAVKQGQPWTVMCSYNQINGVFSSDNKELLTDILRDQWGFEGFVETDWGAMNNRVEALKAGCDLEMPGDIKMNTQKLIDAVKNGELKESDLDTSVERILNKVFQYAENHEKDVKLDFEAHHEEARKIADESMVLLKNSGILPLNKTSKIAFIGAFAEKPRFQGGGSSHVNSYKVTSSVEAASAYNVTYSQGFITKKDEVDEDLLKEAVKSASEAETAVLFLGIPDGLESEGFDRDTLDLPACQNRLVSEVLKVQKNVVVVVENGSPVAMPWIKEVKGVLFAYLAGEAAGQAIIDILFGDVNPSGKLAETFPVRIEDNPSYLFYPGEVDKVDYREGIFVGYRYYDKKKTDVLFPFGFGLSYTTFEYSDLKLSSKDIKDTDSIQVTAKIKNTGSVSGKESVQLYVINAKGKAIRPIKEIKGFVKVSLKPGEEKEVSFTLDKRSFAYYNEDIHDWMVETGDYGIAIAKSSRDIQLQDTVHVTSTTVFEKKPFTMLSTFGDIVADPKGAQIISQLMSKSPLGNLSGDALGADVMKMMIDIPLRGMVSLSGGLVTMEAAQQLLNMLNA
jgi:beta-glucosidase